MAKEKAPAFQFYPKDFLTDERVVLMSNTELGIYIRLLCFCWLEGTLPLETESLARMARMPLKQFTKVWEHSELRACFQVADDGRLHHKRLDEERDKQSTFKRRKSDNGKAGAEARWAKDGKPMAQPSNGHGTAIHLPMANDSSSSPSSSPVSNLQKEQGDARGKRPVFTGQRLTVFDWQLDDCVRTLGALADGFDLHEWFFALDASAVQRGLVIPKRDGGAWLQAQLVAEAQRRGIALEMARPPAIPRAGASFRADPYAGWVCPHVPECGHPTKCRQLTDLDAFKRGA